MTDTLGGLADRAAASTATTRTAVDRLDPLADRVAVPLPAGGGRFEYGTITPTWTFDPVIVQG